jgi:acyl-coenzyme A synthetase/AMP-(fatty) acid ligase
MNLSEKTKITFTPGNLLTFITTIAAVIGLYFHLNAQIEDAKELPKPKNDKIVREAVLQINGDMQYIKEEITEIKSRLDKMEERLYELK